MAAAETAEAVDAQQAFAEEEKLYAERHAAYLAILERRKGDMQVCLSIEENLKINCVRLSLQMHLR